MPVEIDLEQNVRCRNRSCPAERRSNRNQRPDFPGWRVERYLESTAKAVPSAHVHPGLRLADEALWVEILNLGGYNLLVKPFHSDEVIRTVHGALLARRNVQATSDACLEISMAAHSEF